MASKVKNQMKDRAQVKLINVKSVKLFIFLSLLSFSNVKGQSPTLNKSDNDTIADQSLDRENAATSALEPKDIDLSSYYHSSVVPLAPNAASLGRYSVLPIAKYTGVPNINVPIWNLKSHQLSLPVSLNYHSGGTKVEDIASWVGMGWSLQAGGAIMREVNGLPDELPTFGYFSTKDKIGNFDALSEADKKLWIDRSDELTYDTEPDVFYFNFAGRNGKIIFDHQGMPRVLPHQNLKIEYDKSGDKISEFTIITDDGNKYLFGRLVNSIEETKYSSLKIPIIYTHNYVKDVCDDSDPEAFIHHVYTGVSSDPRFDYGQMALESNLITNDYFNSTWYLSRIESPNSDFIDFSYTDNGSVVYATSPQITHSRMLTTAIIDDCAYIGGVFVADFSDCLQNPDSPLPPLSEPWGPPVCGNSFSAHSVASGPSIMTSQSKVYIKLKRLSEITTKTGTTLKFFVDSDLREDLPGSRMLSYISVFFDYHIKTFNFDYQVVTSDAYTSGKDLFSISEALAFKGKNIPGQSPLQARNGSMVLDQIDNLQLREFIGESLKEYNYKRTFLTSITESSGSVHLPPYKFEYRSPEKLPRRSSLMKSAWGYTIDGFPLMENVPAASGSMEVINAQNPRVEGFPEYGILDKITYPTGGYRVFNYVPNHSYAGISIKSISDYDKLASLTSVTHYNYAGGHPISLPNFVSYQDFAFGEKIMKIQISTSNSLIKIGSTQGNFVGHDEVSVKKTKIDIEGTPSDYEVFKYMKQGDQQNPIYTLPAETFYPSFPNVPVEERTKFNNIFPFAQNTSYDHQRGLLKEHLVYKQSWGVPKRIVRHLVNNYKFSPLEKNEIYGLKGSKIGTHVLRYRGAYYKHIVEWPYLESSIKEVYDDDDPENVKKITSTINYEYDPNRLQLRKTSANDSEGNLITTNYKYPQDYYFGSAPWDDFTLGIAGLITKNMTSTVIEKTNEVLLIGETEPKLLGGELTLFKGYDKVYPYQYLTFSPTSPIDDFTSSRVVGGNPFEFIWDTRYVPEITYDSYDTYGNLLKQTGRDGTVQTYEWGYNNSLLIAQNINPGTAHARRTEYVHEALVGIKSVKDPNGYITSYAYDKSDRLLNIKDHNGNIVQQYWHQYGAQQNELDAGFTMDNPVNAGDHAHFKAANNDLNYGSTSYIWNFGDGSPLQEGPLDYASHVYEKSGTYSVKLIVRNPYYGEKSETKRLEVKGELSVKICASGVTHRDLCGVMSTSVGSCTPSGFDTSSRYVTFKVDDVTGGCGSLSYQWQYKFGYSGSWSNFGGNSTSVTRDFTVMGNHYVRCRVTDECGFSIYSNEKSVTLFESQPGCDHW